MKNKTVLWGFVSGLVVSAAFIAACSGGSSGHSGPMGMAAIVIRDGAVQSSDGRTVTSVVVEISRITLRSAAATDGDDEHEDHHAMNDDGNGGGDDQGDDDQGEDGGGGGQQPTDVVVFDMFRDNGGVPREVDLLTLTDSGMLLNMRRIPVGTYSKAFVTLVGASALFEDDPTQTPVPLLIDGDIGSTFKVDFQPPVVVSETGTTVAAIDIVPVITLTGTDYTLSNDGSSDQSGGCGDGELEIEVEGTVSTVTGDQIELTNFPIVVDLSEIAPVMVAPGMQVEISGFMQNGVMIAQSLEIED